VSDDLAALVASASGPASVDDMLREAMTRLRSEYPDATLHSVQITFSVCDRSDLGRGRQREQDIYWSVQANNERGRGSSSREAFTDLAEEVAAMARVPSIAARVADALRGVPDDGFAREDVIGAARKILEDERRGKR
jgi:hypothetical protein